MNIIYAEYNTHLNSIDIFLYLTVFVMFFIKPFF